MSEFCWKQHNTEDREMPCLWTVITLVYHNRLMSIGDFVNQPVSVATADSARPDHSAFSFPASVLALTVSLFLDSCGMISD